MDSEDTLGYSHSETLDSGRAMDTDLVGAGFATALRMLAEEHDAQVFALRAELARAHAGLRTTQQTSEVDSPASPSLSSGPGPRALPGDPPRAPLHDLDDLHQGSNGDVSQRVSRRVSWSTTHAFSKHSLSSEDMARPSTWRTMEMIQGELEVMKVGSDMRPIRGAADAVYVGITLEQPLALLDTLIGAAIAVNTVLLGVSADCDPEWFGWLVIDSVFALLFLLELFVRIRYSGCRKFFAGSDLLANHFEVVLVALAILEVSLALASRGTPDDATQLTSLFRVVRLFRVFRVVRVMRLEIFTELKVMILGTIGGLRTLMWSILLIVLSVYAVCLALRETLGNIEVRGTGAEYFESVPRSFFTVFRCIVATECADTAGRPIFVLVTQEYGWGFAVIYCTTVVFMTFGLFNVIVAMFVENVVKAAKSKSRQARKERLRNKGFFARKMAELLRVVCDISGEQPDDPSEASLLERALVVEVTPQTLELMRGDPRVQKIFDELDLADEDQANLFNTLDIDGNGKIDMQELCGGIAKIRGEACRSDIISINLMMQDIRAELRTCMASFLRRLHKQEDLLKRIRDSSEHFSEVC